ncbi:MAG: hypothetical protein JWN12_859 [Candidatus Saccharibacteria bacterium]|nr:hypothetical protein [Candidatus Saccharibacteria bacterium]
MTKTTSKYIPSTVRNITYLWVVSLLPIPVLILSSASNPAFVTIIASFGLTLLLSVLLPTDKGNILKFLLPGSVLQVINTALALDYWNEISSYAYPTACGSGFSGGNCFLADGLSIISYIFIIPVFVIVANILFTLNILRKSKK